MTIKDLPEQSGRYTIGRYEVVARLGEGGMADTWLCRDHSGYGLPRLVVIKSLKPNRVSDPDYRAMFVDEGRLGDILDHPNIARIEEVGEHQGLPYMVQEYIEGPSVQQLLRRQRKQRAFDLRLAVRVGLDVARALHHAHTATDPRGNPLEVVHRDVSPSNILVSNEGRGVLIDFGVARFEGRSAQTQTGILKGKLRFMAPETIVKGVTNPQTDLYGLGVVLHMLCVGQHAWTGEAIGDRLAGSIPRPSLRRPDLPEDLEEILMRLLDGDPRRRYRSAAELAEVLSGWLEQHGEVSDAELAGMIGALFPEGPTNWRSIHGTATHSALGGPAPTLAPPPRSSSSWLPILAVGGIGAVALGITATALGLLVIATLIRPAAPEPEPITASAPVPRDESSIAGLLDAAEESLVAGNLEGASAQLENVSGLSPTDPVLQQRQQHLEARLHVQTRIRSIETLIRIEPGEALKQAMALDDEFPGERALTQLIARAEAAARGEVLPPAKPIPVMTAPRPAPVKPRPVAAALPAPEIVPEPPQEEGTAEPQAPVAIEGMRAPDFAAAPEPRLRDPFGTGGAPSESLKSPFQSKPENNP